jgi:hypothetical protein
MADIKEAQTQSHLRSRRRKRAPVKPGWRAAKETSTHRGGHPGFVPTHTERRFVQAMAGLRMSADEICAVIGSGRNGEDTGKPISKATLYRHFRNELANGRAMLKARVAGKFYAALDNDAPWAIQMAMRNQFGWDNGRSGFQIALDGDSHGTVAPVTLEFVLPSPTLEPPRDVTPPKRIEADVHRDYQPPADPTVLEGHANPPSSGVRLVKPKKHGWMD